MKIKDLLIPVAFGLITTWTVQYLFFPRVQQTVSEGKPGAEFLAPVATQTAQPLTLEVDFNDASSTRAEALTKIDTPGATYVFSNNGAVLQNVIIKKKSAHQENEFAIITPPATRENGAFLVALNDLGQTPYYYDLISQQKEGDTVLLTYKAESEKAQVIKSFRVYDNAYRIDLDITLLPKGQTSLQARVLFPAPFLDDPTSADVVSAVIYSDRNTFVKKSIIDTAGRGWEHPLYIGVEDRYFAHMLVQDTQKFTQRAYFKPEQTNRLIAILEGPVVSEKTQWSLSFYCGPKESEAFELVDSRLDGLLDYGWFAPISKPLLYVLKFLYSFLHNYGFAIIALTLLLKLIMAPFAAQAEKSSKLGAEMKRKLSYIEQKYRHDPATLERERGVILRKQGLSMLGCLPVLLQIPIFIGLNRVLSSSIELYKAPFIGWITDLSARDPYYVLPLLVGLGMFAQQFQTKNAPQMLSMGLLALVLTGVSTNLAAGLCLFIAVSTWASIGQTYIQKALKAW